jgi:hypothetical protein
MRDQHLLWSESNFLYDCETMSRKAARGLVFTFTYDNARDLINSNESCSGQQFVFLVGCYYASFLDVNKGT